MEHTRTRFLLRGSNKTREQDSRQRREYRAETPRRFPGSKHGGERNGYTDDEDENFFFCGEGRLGKGAVTFRTSDKISEKYLENTRLHRLSWGVTDVEIVSALCIAPATYRKRVYHIYIESLA